MVKLENQDKANRNKFVIIFFLFPFFSLLEGLTEILHSTLNQQSATEWMNL